MTVLGRMAHRLHRWASGGRLRIWHTPAYRLPLPSVESAGIDVRRAELALGYLLHGAVVSRRTVNIPKRIKYQDLARVHTRDHLESLQSAAKLATIFAVDPSEIVVDQLLLTVRLACGGTLAAARHALATRRPCMNLLGGFHHAGPARAAGFCPVNDVAVAIATLRAEGVTDDISVLDLDAHPPDGISECLVQDSGVWIGSLSGTDWGALPLVDETILPQGCRDAEYLRALDALLSRMPRAGLAFVIAGGDVLEGDRCGGLGLTLGGARKRDLRVRRALNRSGSVWLPGGGYSADAWRVLAGTGLALSLGSEEAIPEDYDGLRSQFAYIARTLNRALLEGPALTEQDVLADLGATVDATPRFLGYYTAEGLEYALFRYGILSHLRRLGYGDFHVLVDREPRGDRVRLMATANAREHLLFECVAERQQVLGQQVLYVHWLTLRNPRARFSGERPRLPGQEVPGLGLIRETGELLGRAAQRLELQGIALRPAWYHIAYAAMRMGMRFVDAARQGRFEALIRDLSPLHLLDATIAVAERRVRMNGEPYTWEADVMVYRSDGGDFGDEAEVARERERVRFSFQHPPR